MMAERFEIFGRGRRLKRMERWALFCRNGRARPVEVTRAVIGELAGEGGGRVHPPYVVAHNGPPIYPPVLREMRENSAHGATEFAGLPMKAWKDFFGIFDLRNTEAQLTVVQWVREMLEGCYRFG